MWLRRGLTVDGVGGYRCDGYTTRCRSFVLRGVLGDSQGLEHLFDVFVVVGLAGFDPIIADQDQRSVFHEILIVEVETVGKFISIDLLIRKAFSDHQALCCLDSANVLTLGKPSDEIPNVISNGAFGLVSVKASSVCSICDVEPGVIARSLVFDHKIVISPGFCNSISFQPSAIRIWNLDFVPDQSLRVSETLSPTPS